MRLVALALVVALLVSACSGGDPSPAPVTTSPNESLPEDRFVRPVRMASGLALGHVQPETGSQILCQVLAKEQWTSLLDSRVGRRPAAAPEAACLIATEGGGVNLRLRKSDEAFPAETTIAGRPAATTEDSDGNVEFTVALTDDALRPATRQYRPARQVLELGVIGGDTQEQTALATRVLDEIVPLLAAEGDPLPTIDGQGRIDFVSTPLSSIDEFVDLPVPVQALQLCTVLRERVAATGVELFEDGRCRLETEQGPVTVAVQDTPDAVADYPDRIADRPSRTLLDPPDVLVRLVDDAQVELFVSAPDAVALAGEVVPLLIR